MAFSEQLPCLRPVGQRATMGLAFGRKANQAMLNHIVAMRFKSGVKDADIDDFEKSLDDLPNKIVEIQMYEFGRDVLHTERSFDFALVALFANQEALQRYQQHPEHQKVVQKIKLLCERVITVDFFGTDAGDLKIQSDSQPPL
jgi:hypothetical protein